MWRSSLPNFMATCFWLSCNPLYDDRSAVWMRTALNKLLHDEP